MKRGKTERETCDLNGWGVGTVLRGHEVWSDGRGTWTTIRITAVGESSILARCLRHEPTFGGEATKSRECTQGCEHMWTLRYRDWTEAMSNEPEEATK